MSNVTSGKLWWFMYSETEIVINTCACNDKMCDFFSGDVSGKNKVCDFLKTSV
jgi:hypothetical protein